MKNRLKLFIWTEFSPDYVGGLAFAIAHNETEAKELIETERGYAVDSWGILEIKPLRRKIARCVTGGM